jgi:GTP-binding protein
MRIDSAEFVLSAGEVSECPAGARPEIAMSGRSNVGKSSLLNALLRRKALAKVSGTPGKTQRLGYILVNDRFHLVDLPGYGYAHAAGSARNRWAAMMQGYLRARRQLVAVLQLVDSRHEPSREDREMVRWLGEERLPFCLVATKIDKIGPSKREPAMQALLRTLELPDTQPRVACSSETGEGRDAVLAWIEQALESATRAGDSTRASRRDGERG